METESRVAMFQDLRLQIPAESRGSTAKYGFIVIVRYAVHIL